MDVLTRHEADLQQAAIIALRGSGSESQKSQDRTSRAFRQQRVRSGESDPSSSPGWGEFPLVSKRPPRRWPLLFTCSGPHDQVFSAKGEQAIRENLIRRRNQNKLLCYDVLHCLASHDSRALAFNDNVLLCRWRVGKTTKRGRAC